MAGNQKNSISLKEVNDFISQEVNKRFSFNKFDAWNDNENNVISKKAEHDGKKNIPETSTSRPQNTELFIESNFKAKQIELLNPGLLLLNQLNDGPVRNLRQQIDDTSAKDREIEIEEAKIETQIEQENEKLNTEKEKFSEQITEAENQISDIKNRFDAKVGTIGRDKPKRWNKYMSWAGIIILALVEVPLNSKVFEFFRLNRIETYITSGILIFAFPILSHFTGRALHKNTTGKPNYKAAIPMFVFIVLLCFIINLFRVDYIAQSTEDIPTGEGLGFLKLISTTSFWMAFLINLTMFVSAIIISYHIHDPDFEFESIYNEFKGKTPKLQAEIEQIQDDMAGADRVHRKKLNQLESDRAGVLKKIEDHHSRMLRDLNDYKMAHDTLIQYMQNLQEYINEKYHASIRLYRSQNQFFRTSSSPSYWENDITDLPDLIEDRGFRELNTDEITEKSPAAPEPADREKPASIPATDIVQPADLSMIQENPADSTNTPTNLPEEAPTT